ncbi:pyridoxamine 5'-phosphate oxidase family protein [Streptomyces sp. NPDC020403]|uniref:pyridoxamine 5'-phosphate oxidase family protein n=1 Tax=unclassified Streptomyces TaxID=2593676 RepID=UPI0033E46537
MRDRPEQKPARGPEQRRKDVLDRLEQDDAWVATVSSDAVPCLVPLSFVRDRETLLLATRRTNPTAANVTHSGQVRIVLGGTRDVVLIEGTAETVEGSALPTSSGDAFAAKLHWDPRGRPAWVYLRITPRTVKAWREVNELAGRDLMADGVWLI